MPSSFLKNLKIKCGFFIGINLIQLIFIEFKLKGINRTLAKYYVSIIALATLILNYEIFNFFIGLVFVAIILLIIEKVMKHNNYTKTIATLLAIDSLLLVGYDVPNSIFILYGLLQICIASYILFIRYKMGKTTGLFGLKTMCLFVYMVNSSIIPSSIAYSISGNLSDIIKYLGATIMLIVLSAIGFFKEWDTKDFKLFSKNEDIPDDKTKYLFYFITTILYIQGIGLIDQSYHFNLLIVIISTLAIALTQTMSLLKYYNESRWVGFWIGLQYWILTWTSLISIFNLDENSIILSVAGLIIALGSIAIGFIKKAKSLRLYGLMLTILMVLKFILVDLSQENSITRIFALLLGGLICFGISVLYNKLNNKI